MIDRQEFFREMTARICSSIDLKTAMKKVFDYAQQHMPLSVLRVGIHDAELTAIRIIARASDDEDGLPDQAYQVSNELWAELTSLQYYQPGTASAQLYGPILINGGPYLGNNGLYAKMITLMKEEEYSRILVPLCADGEYLGTLSFNALGADIYSPEHLELVAALASPFAIALVNALAYEKLLKYQDSLPLGARHQHKEPSPQTWDDIIGGKSGLRNVMEMVQQVSALNTTVLLLGETGTGKEVIANSIHYSSPRKNGPFVKVNCGAISPNLIESELFGHERGAFTGAVAGKKGQFERANGGTLFLDEIGEMPLESQVRLLRVLQSKEIGRVGGEKQISVDVRVIAATHRNLKQMVADGNFREDLWYRLNVFPIILPPLRQRLEDVPALTRYCVAQKSRELGIELPPPIAPGSFDRLMTYNWPGNVRELENLVERELIRFQGGQLMFGSLVAESSDCEKEAPPEEPHGTPLTLDEAACLHITKTLRLTNGKIHGAGGAAELLNINPNTLRARMRSLGILHSKKKQLP